MNDLTPEEVKAMKGTEFIYIYSDGEEVPAFIAQAELGKGLTCKALLQIASNGYKVWEDEEVKSDPSGYDNIICYPTDAPELNNNIQRILKQIKELGTYKTIRDSNNPPFGSMATCSFS